MNIKYNIEQIKESMPKDVTLVAVSKTKPIELLEEAYSAGIRDFAENKVQELMEKFELFHKDVRWHFIGHLQTNKVKYIVDKAFMIHSLDSIKLLKELEKQCNKQQLQVNTLIQINIGKEESKYGFYEEDLDEIFIEVEKCNCVKIKGIMVIIPKGDEESNRYYFKRTKNIYEKIKEQKYQNVTMEILSMGMTHDYKTALEEGANLVRIGEGIFGKRI
ncbi:YggS family pyridoxal phosphate-dependent enzyme [Clostridium manihotivorum]|uniref:Pyridoxal phosphate homeostasis protein n=1 Tax=Clostridium manihotivorum TaxID=2320868 RepID=A0A410DSM5_9CLOT|nr:YggS family pyridoxal phosphate-dependent enzyme [Clostridium manihotivorum]QAA32037.1 YggS family pyridoxal phosphate-dependent enzyme [Clostridium manihotivorum]